MSGEPSQSDWADSHGEEVLLPQGAERLDSHGPHLCDIRSGQHGNGGNAGWYGGEAGNGGNGGNGGAG